MRIPIREKCEILTRHASLTFIRLTLRETNEKTITRHYRKLREFSIPQRNNYAGFRVKLVATRTTMRSQPSVKRIAANHLLRDE